MKNCRVVLAIVLGLIFPVAVFVSDAFTLSAEDTVPVEDVLEDGYAGAAEVIELNIMPSQQEVEEIIEANAWKNPGSLVMSNVNDCVNVRSEATVDSSRIGAMYKDCAGYIIEYTDTWTLLQTGNLTGWVCNDYLLFGDEAQALADTVGVYRATVNCDCVNVRKDASLDAGIYDTVDKGELFEVIDTEGEWILVDFQGSTGYINLACVDVVYHIDAGETLEEIEEREAAERAAKREAERIQYYGVYAAGASDVELLGALIQCEAGTQSYEGMVAVGAVVMNRVRSAAYPNSIYGVVYAAGQFTPAYSGAVDRRIAAGVSSTALQAAQDAINGYSNVGGATQFRSAASGFEGIVLGGHVFW